ncbi:LPS export ABC transporter periplasmic protein LptC [Bacteroidia bacterium]|nr:LPS export ABC transporter periplasmic protein LptC [Bacteroidia bacterium]GHT61892.1 LPS export ABC transporter periplasmic protein LptC [Bacteroidia bacterium]
MISCNKKSSTYQVVPVDAKTIPISRTEDVVSLISDSGITRYRLKAKVWEVYTLPEDYWYFPEKFYMEQFDSLLNIKGSVEADTAYYFSKKELWQLIGNVIVKNLEGTTFETSELFWNTKAPANAGDAIYTGKLAKVTRANGDYQYGRLGFKSDAYLNNPQLYSVGGEMSVKELPSDSAATQ